VTFGFGPQLVVVGVSVVRSAAGEPRLWAAEENDADYGRGRTSRERTEDQQPLPSQVTMMSAIWKRA
jgi:hypothetical protein